MKKIKILLTLLFICILTLSTAACNATGSFSDAGGGSSVSSSSQDGSSVADSANAGGGANSGSDSANAGGGTNSGSDSVNAGGGASSDKDSASVGEKPQDSSNQSGSQGGGNQDSTNQSSNNNSKEEDKNEQKPDANEQTYTFTNPEVLYCASAVLVINENAMTYKATLIVSPENTTITAKMYLEGTIEIKKEKVYLYANKAVAEMDGEIQEDTGGDLSHWTLEGRLDKENKTFTCTTNTDEEDPQQGGSSSETQSGSTTKDPTHASDEWNGSDNNLNGGNNPEKEEIKNGTYVLENFEILELDVIDGELTIEAGKDYTLTLKTINGEVYFIQGGCSVEKTVVRLRPEIVLLNGEDVEHVEHGKQFIIFSFDVTLDVEKAIASIQTK